MKTNIDIINECDNFPYYENDPEKYIELRSSCWEFHLSVESGPRGYIRQFVVDKMPWDTNSWQLDHGKRRVTPIPRSSSNSEEQIIRDTLEQAKAGDIFQVLRGWRNELNPIYAPYSSRQPSTSMERAGSALFGINTYGVHLTAYQNTSDCMRIWVPRRARSKQTYGGMLDNTVAGGLSTGEQAFECIVREATEEASFPEQLIRSSAKACGTVSYFHIRDERAGGEPLLFQPECQHVYDMEVGPEVVPKPGDDEVEAFYLWTVDEVKKALREGQFKPNCAIVLLDFFIRHGILTAENEVDYIEIVSRIHRKLPFPTT